MKITNAPRTSERPALKETASQNTGIVPQKNTGIVPQKKNTGIVPQKRPGDGFETASARNTGITGGVNTGVTGGVTKGGALAKVNTDFKLSANLEPFRKTFDFAGRRIARLPTEELRQSAIGRLTERISKRLGELASKDEIKAGIDASAAARLAYNPYEVNEPRYGSYKCDAMLSTGSPKLQSLGNTLKDIGLPIARDSSIQGKKAILDAAKPQLDTLGLKGRDKRIAKNYIVSLVEEERARLGTTPTTNGNTGITGTGQLTLPQTVRP